MKFIKNNGTKVAFEKGKITKAIKLAMRDGGVYKPQIAEQIANEIEEHFLGIVGYDGTVSRKEVEDYLFDLLVKYDQNLTAKSYEDYKTLRQYQNQDMDIDEDILELLSFKNKDLFKENSNKDARENSTVRDLVAGEASKSISKRKLLPPHLVHAHKEGIIHIHDLDYYLQPMHNCFRRDTRFITKDGVKSFYDFSEGDTTMVLTHKGNWKKAVVHSYGWQTIQKVTFKNNAPTPFEKTVYCTPNHRWILQNGIETTDLKKGDKLWIAPEYTAFEVFSIEEAQLDSKEEVWCLEVENDHSFILEGGIPTGNCCLINLKDMFENGTAIKSAKINRPHSFRTACTIATQIIACVASSQFGGQTISTAHLAPFIRDSYNYYIQDETNNYIEEGEDVSNPKIKNKIQRRANKRIKKAITDGVQTLNYQINTLSTANGRILFWLSNVETC